MNAETFNSILLSLILITTLSPLKGRRELRLANILGTLSPTSIPPSLVWELERMLVQIQNLIGQLKAVATGGAR